MPEGISTTPDGATPTPDGTPAPAAPQPATASGDRPLGDGGKKALEAERAARREIEAQFAQMRDGLAQVFGIKSDSKAGPDAVLSDLTGQVSELRRDAAVYRLASEHGITEKDDIDLLRSAKDEEAMTRLAARLAVKAEAAASTPGTPKPDLTQGGTSGGGTPPALNSDALTESLKKAVGAQ